MADIKKDPTQNWDLSDEYYHENLQSDELRLEDFMNSSPTEFAGNDGSTVCDEHDSVVQDGNAHDANAHDRITHEANAHDRITHKANAQDRNTHETNAQETNAQDLSHVAQLVSRATALSCQGKTAAAIAEELNITEQYVNDILVCVQAFPGDNPVAVAHMLMEQGMGTKLNLRVLTYYAELFHVKVDSILNAGRDNGQQNPVSDQLDAEALNILHQFSVDEQEKIIWVLRFIKEVTQADVYYKNMIYFN